MAKCIYCLCSEPVTTFTSREHVIPASLGKFSPLNPTLAGNLVCRSCNSGIFSPLETNFIEDSLEGFTTQRLNLNGRRSVTLRGKNLQIEKISGFGDKFLDEAFLFLKPDGGKLVPHLKPQIKLHHFRGGYRVFLPEALSEIKEGSTRFKKISQELQRLDQRDINIFAENEADVRQIIALLHGFGIPYKERESRGRLFRPGERFELREEYTVRLDRDVGRVLAKIAFNYFAYCAKASGMESILYDGGFNRIRNFIYAGAGILKEIIPSINEGPLLHAERDTGERVIGHILTFRAEDGLVVSRMSFFGLPAVYKVIIGVVPPGIDARQFGCGHFFDPFSRQIMNLSQEQRENPTAEEIKASFGLHRRNPINTSSSRGIWGIIALVTRWLGRRNETHKT